MMTTKDPLVSQIEALEQTLAMAPTGQETAWTARLQDNLRGLEAALGRQPRPSDKSIQSLELQRREISPGVTRETATLRQDQQAMLQEIDGLAGQLERHEHRPEDIPALQQMGAALVKSLQKFCASKNKLIFDNVMRDTGAGD
jgi:predicted ATPase